MAVTWHYTRRVAHLPAAPTACPAQCRREALTGTRHRRLLRASARSLAWPDCPAPETCMTPVGHMSVTGRLHVSYISVTRRLSESSGAIHNLDVTSSSYRHAVKTVSHFEFRFVSVTLEPPAPHDNRCAVGVERCRNFPADPSVSTWQEGGELGIRGQGSGVGVQVLGWA